MRLQRFYFKVYWISETLYGKSLFLTISWDLLPNPIALKDRLHPENLPVIKRFCECLFKLML